MEVISIDGIEYLKASTAAKRFKYTADYIGQLCRSRKVDAKLIGRTWYINPLTLTKQKSARPKKTGVDEISKAEAIPVAISRVAVNSVLSKKTVRGVVTSTDSQNYAKRIGWKPLTYESDDSELIPFLSNDKTTAKLRVTMADSTKLSIREQSDPVTDLEAEALPEVVLTGKVMVDSVEDTFENNEENIDVSDSYAKASQSGSHPSRSTHSTLATQSDHRERLVESRPSTASSQGQARLQQVKRVASYGDPVAPQGSRVTEAVAEAEISFFDLKFWFLLLGFLVLVGLLVSLDFVVVADALSSKQTWTFSFPKYPL